MFTGIITEVGTIETAVADQTGLRLGISAPASARGLIRGGSVSVDGVCLTAESVGRGRFTARVVPETLRRSTFESAAKGRRVNLERPLGAGQEIGGHFVQGHVDGRARVAGLERRGKEVRLEVELPRNLGGLIVEKGSIAINGVSLTVAGLSRGRSARFWVALVPHTLRATTLGQLSPGDRVNLEADILGKYVRAQLERRI